MGDLVKSEVPASRHGNGDRVGHIRRAWRLGQVALGLHGQLNLLLCRMAITCHGLFDFRGRQVVDGQAMLVGG